MFTRNEETHLTSHSDDKDSYQSLLLDNIIDNALISASSPSSNQSAKGFVETQESAQYGLPLAQFSGYGATASSASNRHVRGPRQVRTKSGDGLPPVSPSKSARHHRVDQASHYFPVETKEMHHEEQVVFSPPWDDEQEAMLQAYSAHSSGYGSVSSNQRLQHPNVPGHRRSKSGEPLSHFRKLSDGDDKRTREELSPGFMGSISTNQRFQHPNVPGHRRSKSGEPLSDFNPLQSITGITIDESQAINLRSTPSPSRRPGHRRIRSAGGLPPVSPLRENKYYLPGVRSSNNLRSFSSENPLIASSRCRASSASSVMSERTLGSCAVSVASAATVTSNIASSALFKGVTDTGVIRFHLPMDNVRLIIDPAIEPGVICKTPDDDEARFTDYHRPASQLEYLSDDDDMFDLEACPCCCLCDNCIQCRNKKQGLPQAQYVMTIDQDLYKRVLSEIADSRNMPCGLYFCGHHDDVDRPSVNIAIVLVVLLFLGLFYVAFDM